MESANLHHHHHQQEDHLQHLLDSSCYGASCFQNPILNGARNTNASRDLKQLQMNHSIDLVPPVQDLGLYTMESFMASHELHHLARIKHEISLSEIVNRSPTSSIEDLHYNNDHQGVIRYNNNENNQEMFLKTFSNGCQIKGDHHQQQQQHQQQHMNMNIQEVSAFSEESVSYSDHDHCYNRGTTFSQILPTITISSLNNQSSSPLMAISSSSAFDINLPAHSNLLDPFGSSTFDHHGSLISYQPSSLNVHNLGGLLKDNFLSYGLHQMHQPNHRQDASHNKISPAFMEAKRSAKNYMDAKALKANPLKKSKLELRPSCAPLKIRKEKLGDRISALQQMVAPFGKTDTASVLMEAIGYIKFLQSQVETLSVPYMNLTQKATRASTRGGSVNNGNEEMKRDLRSRGLCLVPLSCLSYVTYGGGSIWANP